MKDRKKTHEFTDQRRAVDAAFEKLIEDLHTYSENPLSQEEVLKLVKEKAKVERTNHSAK